MAPLSQMTHRLIHVKSKGHYSSSSGESSDEAEYPQPRAKRRRITGNEGRGMEAEEHNEEGSDTFRKQGVISYHIPSRIHKTSPTNLSPKSTQSRVSTKVSNGTDFESLNVSPWLVHSLHALSIHTPTEIQRTCIPEILKGRDCIGGSRTGTGKTIAFAVPILQQWAKDPFGIYAVILTPTRELALQIYEQFVALGSSQSLKVVLITGGTEMRPQALALGRRPHIVVATPGRLADHIQTSGSETIAGLKRAKVVVMDEADRLFESGPGSMLPDINTCLSALPPSSERLTLLFTATVTPEVRALKSAPRPKSKPPVFISEIASDLSGFSTSPTPGTSLIPPSLRQTYIQTPLTHKDAFLHVLLLTILSPSKSTTTTTTSTPSTTPTNPSIIVFANRTSTADILHRTLLSLSHPVTSLHSTLPQRGRNRNLTSFRSRTSTILIATDVASRGLDIPEVSHVINYDVPRNPIDYVHRVGRTARAGRKGTSITFVSQRDVDLVLAIEAYVSGATGASVDGDGDGDGDGDDAGKSATVVNEKHKMQEWKEEGVNLETRVVRGRTLKDVGEARMEALRDVEGDKGVNGYRRKMRKDRKRETLV